MQAIIKSIDLDEIKLFIIASPGIVRDEFMTYLMQQGEKAEYSKFKANSAKFFIVRTSTGFKSSLNEVLADTTIMTKLKDTKASKEVEILDKFFRTLKVDSDKVSYGPKYVFEACVHKAISDLLISDKVFKTRNLDLRKKYVNLVDEVKDYGGNVYLFSSGHFSGEKLDDLSGIAAILRFPLNMDYLDEKEDVEEEKETSFESDDNAKLGDMTELVNNEELDQEFMATLSEAKQQDKDPRVHSHKEKDKDPKEYAAKENKDRGDKEKIKFEA